MKNFFAFGRVDTKSKETWLRECLVQNESKLIRYVKNLTHDLEIARDIVQEGFLKLWQEDPEKLKGHETQWLFTTCRNRAYDHLRKKGTKALSTDEIELEVADTALNAEETLFQLDEQKMVEHLISTLSVSQREILHMKFEQNLSYKEISQITGLSVSHVGVLIHNIVLKLKEKMQNSNTTRRSL